MRIVVSYCSILTTRRYGAALLFCVFLVGCGDGSVDVYPVTGKVTYQNQALAEGFVTFVPNQGVPVRCVIDSQGNYETRVPEGRCRVAVLAPQHDGSAAAGNASEAPDHMMTLPTPAKQAGPRIPERYANHDKSGLSLDVQPTSENKYDIALR